MKTDNQIAYYQQLLRRNPQSAKAYIGLGDALIRKARETGDPSYFNRAEEALKRSRWKSRRKMAARCAISPTSSTRATSSHRRPCLRAQSDGDEC